MKADAPAKINLALDIMGRREDGYHLLNMVMQSVSLCDEISAAKAEAGVLEAVCDDASVPCGADNTVMRAARAFFEKTGVSPGFGIRFYIKKRIPQQAGLGGGSTDAAAALRLLNKLFNTRLSAGQLQSIGLMAGADVPFCVEGGTAFVSGIGENIVQISSMPPCHIVLCRPDVGISTSKAYLDYDRQHYKRTYYSRQVRNALRLGRLAEIGKSLGNAFELAGVPDEIHKIEGKMLEYGATGSCMTGSGSAVFGIFTNYAEAAACKSNLALEYKMTFLCRPLRRREIL